MSRRFLPLWLAALAACAGPGRDAAPAPANAPPPDSARPARVVLVSGPLRIAPAAEADGVADAAAGTTLRAVADTTVDGRRWVRLATWDDRTGWMPASSVMEPGLWTHYVEALGGAPPTATRPAYPIGDGAWGAEKPFPSPDFDPPAAVRLAADSMVGARVVRRDTLSIACSGARLSMALLDRGAPRATRLPGGDLSRGVIAIPTDRVPRARALAVGPLEPEPALAAAVRRASVAALEAGPAADAAGADVPAPGAGPQVDWRAAGSAAAWAVASWAAPADGTSPPGRWAVAFVAARAKGGWTVRTAIPLRWTVPEPGRAPWALVSAVATVPDRPTLLAVEETRPGGGRIDLYLADDAGYRGYYRGFPHGC